MLSSVVVHRSSSDRITWSYQLPALVAPVPTFDTTQLTVVCVPENGSAGGVMAVTCRLGRGGNVIVSRVLSGVRLLSWPAGVSLTWLKASVTTTKRRTPSWVAAKVRFCVRVTEAPAASVPSKLNEPNSWRRLPTSSVR